MSAQATIELGETTLEKLNELIRVNIDSQKGFELVAQRSTDTALQSVARRIAQERHDNAEELKNAIIEAGEEPADRGSVLGTVHRWWTSIRDSLTGDDAYSLLAEAERGEEGIQQAYEQVIQATTGNPVNDVLHRQYRGVKTAHDEIRDWRQNHKASA